MWPKWVLSKNTFASLIFFYLNLCPQSNKLSIFAVLCIIYVYHICNNVITHLNKQRWFQLKCLQIIRMQESYSYIYFREKKTHKKAFNLSNNVVNFETSVTGVRVLKGVSNLRNNIACIVQYAGSITKFRLLNNIFTFCKVCVWILMCLVVKQTE